MSVPEGFKQTEVGVIPDDWKTHSIENLIVPNGLIRGPFGGSLKKSCFVSKGIKVYEQRNAIYKDEKIGRYYIEEQKYNELKRFEVNANDFIVSCSGTIGKIYQIPSGFEKGVINQALLKITIDTSKHSDQYFYQFFQWDNFQKRIIESTQGGAMKNLIGMSDFKKVLIPLPPTRAEQTAIAAALSDMDALVEGVEKLLEKKRRIKQGAMQELLRPKEGWKSKTLAYLINCLDSLRVPLNESQRLKIKGNIPYCGANGIVDYIDDYLIDDKVILMAEDGGYFDEHDKRPIAYQVSGRCWVNNHAHVLKAKEGYDQDFIFYSLVHKDIRFFLSSGTRSKLTKGEMLRIEINIPNDESAQMEVSQILSDMDNEIEQLETQLTKYRQLKTGMMQELLTGKKRLV